MNEGDFDKLFNEKFKDFEGSDFSSTEWGDLESRLKKRKNRRKGLFWLFPLLLLSALAGGGLATWYLLQQNNKQTPTQPFIEQNERNSTTDTLRDTILKRSIIFQYDTIYRKILMIDEQYLPNPSSILGKKFNDFLINEKKQTDKLAQLNTSLTPNSDTGILVTVKNVLPPTPKTSNSIEQTPLEDKKNATNITAALNKISEGSIEKISKQEVDFNMPPLSKNEEKVNDTLQNIANITTEPEKKEEELKGKEEEKELKPIIKTPFRFPPIFLGMVASRVDGIDGIKAANYSESGGSQVGIRVGVQASKKINFFTEFNYGQFHFESSAENTLPSGITIPPAEPSYTLKYWTVEGVSVMNYILGMQYKFRENHNLKPFVAIGINGSTTLPYEIKFEYINVQNNLEKYILQKVTKAKTNFNNLYAAIGVHWYPLSKLRFSAEGFTSYSVTNAPLMPLQVGLKVGVFYSIEH